MLGEGIIMIDIKSVIVESLQNLDEGLGWKDIQGKDITVTVKNAKGSQDKVVYVSVGGKQSLWSSGLGADDMKELVAEFEKQAKSVKLNESQLDKSDTAIKIQNLLNSITSMNKGGTVGKPAIGPDGVVPNSVVVDSCGGVAIKSGSKIYVSGYKSSGFGQHFEIDQATAKLLAKL